MNDDSESEAGGYPIRALGQGIAQERVVAAQQAAMAAVEALAARGSLREIEALIDGAAPDDAARLRALLGMPEQSIPMRQTSDELAPGWQRGGYPYKYKMLRKDYEREKFLLQAELLKFQTWIKETG
ncbi:MAG: polyphosphate kinase 2, partial [Novosphingobium sp.]|nr:polyphosphate kinase 2 [Novosphingobium sp.]